MPEQKITATLTVLIDTLQGIHRTEPHTITVPQGTTLELTCTLQSIIGTATFQDPPIQWLDPPPPAGVFSLGPTTPDGQQFVLTDNNSTAQGSGTFTFNVQVLDSDGIPHSFDPVIINEPA